MFLDLIYCNPFCSLTTNIPDDEISPGLIADKSIITLLPCCLQPMFVDAPNKLAFTETGNLISFSNNFCLYEGTIQKRSLFF